MNIEQLSKRIRNKIQVNKDTGCWEWRTKRKKGYGSVWNTKTQASNQAHTYVYKQLVGPVPEGLEPDHLCRNKKCVNPRHIELVTHKENTLRGHSTNMQTHSTGVCKRGHKVEGHNIITRTRNGTAERTCRVCVNANKRRRYWEAKQKQPQQLALAL